MAVLVVVTLWAFTEDTAPFRTPDSAITESGRADPRDVYDPVAAGEPLPEGFRQLLPRDAIRPVYEPTFTTATGVAWPDETDVIGVEIDGEAKAYPVAFLTGRELVVDELAGWPILVSW